MKTIDPVQLEIFKSLCEGEGLRTGIPSTTDAETASMLLIVFEKSRAVVVVAPEVGSA